MVADERIADAVDQGLGGRLLTAARARAALGGDDALVLSAEMMRARRRR